LSGKRIDVPNAALRHFPTENVEPVSIRIRSTPEAVAVKTLASWAACGSDLIALEQARVLGLRQPAILPFDPRLFRRTSVTDYPGDWGAPSDRLIEALQDNEDRINLSCRSEGDEAYRASNQAVLEAEELATTKTERVLAIIIWDDVSSGGRDHTNSFAKRPEEGAWRSCR
jgi:hypothetical protein